MKLTNRLPHKEYVAGVAAHFTSVYAAISYNELFVLATPLTLLYCLNEAGKHSDNNWIEQVIDTKIELDKTQRWLDEQGVDYETPSFFDTIFRNR